MTTRIAIESVVSHPDDLSPQQALDIAIESLQRGMAEISASARSAEGFEGNIFTVDSVTGTLLPAPIQTLGAAIQTAANEQFSK